jgi:predicted enzyme related to lactoylglutathione lyase
MLLALAGCAATYGGEPPDGSGLDLPPRESSPAATEPEAATPAQATPARATAVESDPAPAMLTPIPEAGMLQGLRTAAYHVEDIEEAKAWYIAATGVEPYFDEPFYVGFNIGGYELGLMPVERGQAPDAGRVVVYWGVADVDVALAHLLEVGAQPNEAVQDVGGGVRVATVRDPFGNILGIIENPSFSLPDNE